MESRRIRRKLVIKIILLTLIFLVSISIKNYIIQNQIEHKLDSIINENMDQSYVKIERLFEQLKMVTEQSAFFMSIQKLLSQNVTKENLTNNDVYNEVILQLNAISKTYNFINTCWMINAKQEYYIEDNGYISNIDWDLSLRAYHDLLINANGSFISEPYISATTNTQTISYFNPIKDENGKLIGAFAVDMDLNYLHSFISNNFGHNNQNMAVVSKENAFISSTNTKLNYNKFDDTTYPLAIKEMITNKQDGIMKAVDDTGTNVIYCIKTLPINDWRLVLSNPADHYYTMLNNESQTISVLLGIILTLLFLCLIFMLFISAQNKIKTQKLLEIDSQTNLYSFVGYSQVVLRNMTKYSALKQFEITLKVRKMNLLNEMLGRDVGDLFILHIAKCLNSILKENEVCCKSSEIYFCLHLFCNSEEECLNRLKLLDKMICSFELFHETNYHVHLIYGCYEIEDNSMDIEEVRQRASIAISRQLMQNTYESVFIFYNKNLQKSLKYEKELEDSAEQAIINRDFTFYLQGKYNAKTLKLESAEALVRWNYHGEKIIPPDHFIPLFETNGFIIKLDLYVLEMVCIKLQDWLIKGINPVPIAVNLSRNHLNNIKVVRDIVTIIDAYNIPHELIEFEITESSIANNTDILTLIVNEFHNNKLTVAIDDFGTGYSTLNTLRTIFVDILKFDREFFVDITNNNRGKAVAKSVIEMAKGLNLITVAEGIETKEQFEFLRDEGIDLIQGYYFSKPIPTDEFEKLNYGK